MENSSMVSSDGMVGINDKVTQKTFEVIDMFLIMTMVSRVYTCVTSHHIAYFKYVQLL